MSILICPVCGNDLDISENSYICRNNHCFDIAKSGYVNLLLSKHSGKSIHGDNKLMLQARRNFLEKGYYSPLRDELCAMVSRNFSGGVILDAGCGEGYYTSAVYDALRQAEVPVDIYGIDISKIAVEMAAKRKKILLTAQQAYFIFRCMIMAVI